MATRTSISDRFNSAFSQPSNRMFRSPTGRFTSDQLIRRLVPATAETRPEDPVLTNELRIQAPISSDFDQLESFVNSYTASRDFASIGVGPPSIVDEIVNAVEQPARPSLNVRPTAEYINNRIRDRETVVDPGPREYFRNLRTTLDLEANPPPLEMLRDRRTVIGPDGPQVFDTWANTTVHADEVVGAGAFNTAHSTSGWLSSGSAQGVSIGMPKPEFAMNAILEKAILEMLKNKLNLKVETQWEGKNIAVKVSLRVTETDEELLSDSDYVQVDSSY